MSATILSGKSDSEKMYNSNLESVGYFSVFKDFYRTVYYANKWKLCVKQKN